MLLRRSGLHDFVVRMDDKTRFKLSNQWIVDCDELGKLVQTRAFEHIERSIRARLEQGETVKFDTIGLTRAGLVIRKELLPWRTITEIEVHPEFGGIAFYQWTRCIRAGTAINKVPNFPVLLSLIRSFQVAEQ
jgi:hypothetical protein